MKASLSGDENGNIERHVGLLITMTSNHDKIDTSLDIDIPVVDLQDLHDHIQPEPALPNTTYPLDASSSDNADSERLIKECFIKPYNPIRFLGDSHIRYLFDYYTGMYVNNAKEKFLSLPHHHAHVKFPEDGNFDSGYISYFPFRFLMQLSEAIGIDGNCAFVEGSESNGVTTFVISIGAWDLDYLPLRDAIDNNINAKKMIQALQSILTLCSTPVRIIWVTTVPNPSRQPGLNWGDSGHRNNYSIGAFNQYLITEIQKLQNILHVKRTTATSSAAANMIGSIEIVDAYELIYPHSYHSVCGNHYLCWENIKDNNGDKVFKWNNLKAGVALADKLLKVLCKQ